MPEPMTTSLAFSYGHDYESLQCCVVLGKQLLVSQPLISCPEYACCLGRIWVIQLHCLR